MGNAFLNDGGQQIAVNHSNVILYIGFYFSWGKRTKGDYIGDNLRIPFYGYNRYAPNKCTPVYLKDITDPDQKYNKVLPVLCQDFNSSELYTGDIVFYRNRLYIFRSLDVPLQSSHDDTTLSLKENQSVYRVIPKDIRLMSIVKSIYRRESICDHIFPVSCTVDTDNWILYHHDNIILRDLHNPPLEVSL